MLVVGLGNPGPRYAGTRHNIGFEVLDRLAADNQLRFESHKAWDALIARQQGQGGGYWLLKPQTYMNLSGRAVASLCRYHRIAESRCLVVYDDVDLPLGRLRLRLGGSAGGHNGLASIIEQMGSADIPRLRIGISSALGRPAGSRMADHVLEPFSSAERPAVDAAVLRATKAIIKALHFGLNAAMNEFNQAPDPK